MPDNFSPKDQVLNSLALGTLIETLTASPPANRAPLIDALVELHNAGTINLLRIFHNTAVLQHRRFFEEALPRLASPPADVATCVAHQLAIADPSDLRSDAVLASFQEYLHAEVGRARQALKAVSHGPPDLGRLLSPILVAGSAEDPAFFSQEALRLCQDSAPQIAASALAAIPGLHWTDTSESSIASALTAISASTALPSVLAAAARCTIRCLTKKLLSTASANSLFPPLTRTADPHTVHACAELLATSHPDLPDLIVQHILRQLENVQRSHVGTIDCLDSGASRLLSTHHADFAIELVGYLLDRPTEPLAADQFPDFAIMLTKDAHLRDRVMTQWFLSGSPYRSKALQHWAERHDAFDGMWRFDRLHVAPLTRTRLVFLSQKAIGYFFRRPTSAASAVLSLFPMARTQEARHALQSLLTNALLLNYPASLGDYLRTTRPHLQGPARLAADQALRLLRSRQRTLQGAYRASHRPPESHLKAHQSLVNTLFRSAYQRAVKASPLLSLMAPPRPILYGNRASYHSITSTGAARRETVDMTHHSVTSETPQYEILDPVRLDLMLRSFRSSRLEQ